MEMGVVGGMFLDRRFIGDDSDGLFSLSLLLIRVRRRNSRTPQITLNDFLGIINDLIKIVNAVQEWADGWGTLTMTE